MSFLAPIALVSLFNATVLGTTTNPPWQTADFQFNWTPPGVEVSVPTTAQCDSINITWNQLNNGSPDPIPPYHLRIYTSTLTYPIVVDAGIFSPFEWTVPFAPDTQYQICMFDSVGHTGGCQDKYTVIPPRNSTRTCSANFTTPNFLSVKGVTNNGPLTQYGWPDQCTDVSLTAQNGTPPYIMMVAPSLHPPLNLTFKDQSPMNWTVTLSWGMQFWISVVDSLGASWAYGPLHSGGNGPTDCLRLAGNSLAIQPATSSPRHVSPGAAVGIALASFFLGIFLTPGAQRILSYIRKVAKGTHEIDHEERSINNAMVSTPGVDPYPIHAARSQPAPDRQPIGGANDTATASVERNDSQVYVVHHDAGGAPITIYTGGREVQELPPHYSGTSPEPNHPNSNSLTHTPSASVDSATNTSSAARRAKMSQPLRSVAN